MNIYRILLVTSMVMFFSGCGGGGSAETPPVSSVNTETPQTIAIDKIKAYADDNTQPAPTVADYVNAGIIGVDADNLVNVNKAVDALTGIAVDTTPEIQAVVDAVLANLAASDTVLVQIGLEADNPDNINSVVTVAQLGATSPVLVNVNPANIIAYRDYIDANPDSFSSPATLDEVQVMIGEVNTIQAAVNPGESNVTASQASVVANGTATSTITVTLQDTNANPVTDAIVTLLQNGASAISPVTNNNDGTYTFTVSSTRAETVTYTVTVGSVAIAQTVEVIFTSSAASVAPLANEQNITMDEGTSIVITLAGSDANNDTLTYTVVTPPSHGTITGTAPNLSYTPDANFSGADSLLFKVNDGTVDSEVATVSITIVALSSTSSPVKKTGQTSIYETYDDGYYQRGVDSNYTRDATMQIVTDNITGLMWQDDDEAIISLVWSEATSYCEALSLGVYSDWRLPSMDELEDIVDYGRGAKPAISPVFIHTLSSSYWSSTAHIGLEYTWYVDFQDGESFFSSESSSNNVRCVRLRQ